MSSDQQDRGLMGTFGHKETEEPATNLTGRDQDQETVIPSAVAYDQKPQAGQGGVMGKLHKCGGSSGSSSSSEDESGVKKERKAKKGGMADKIKNMIPGQKKEGDCTATCTETTTGATGDNECGVKKERKAKTGGMTDKIKNMLPGNKKEDAAGYTPTNTTT
ncbi:hypothetical protein O6H91_11G111200 [Diphasiastrum complanatum]|uniref:Uncharacterized protein n=1 Tax=Diphasiastrum complanatum TaxID=34168 RepID=A0ACC2CCV1_DIPCM|nr:hypothetical protein O6H91_11G111200 [Diphasiastrum complanatum]